jgi:hypothetical protein
VLTLPTVDTIYSLQELPENKGVLLPSLSMDQKIFLPPLAVMLKLKISSVFLPAYLFRVKSLPQALFSQRLF